VSGSVISKIERVHASRNYLLGVDLLLHKDSGLFYADVNGKRVSADTKEKAIKLVRAALDLVAVVEWREVIVLRVDNRPGDSGGMENGKHVHAASCRFEYIRRERAANPLKPKETIEREHRVEFEQRVALVRENTLRYMKGPEGKLRADAEEREFRNARAALVGVESPWQDQQELYEIPYSEEAWTGIQRIAAALHETQAKLDAFARSATPEKLKALATGDVLLQLPGPSQEES
jgi:hypothetical protein